MSKEFGLWMAAICTLAILGSAFKDNPASRVVENIYVGGTAAHALVAGYLIVVKTGITPALKGTLVTLVPIALGLLLYTRYVRQWRHLARIPMAVMVGTGVGLASAGSVSSDILSQIKGTIVPLTSLENILVVLGVMGTVSYFFFTFPQKKGSPMDRLSTVGIWVMMVFFGAQVGMVAMGRLSLLIGRLQFILGDCLNLIKL